jgi:arabinogalactan oligomer/maltooligosaccharide transport system permease protein
MFIAPALVVMAIVTIYPLIFQFWMSFTNYGLANLRHGAPAPNWVGLENYVKILTSELAIPNYSFLRLFLYNIFWALSNVTIHIILGVSIALLLLTASAMIFSGVFRSLGASPLSEMPSERR